MSWFDGAGIGARLRLLFRHRAAESRMDAEFRFHIEMETERLVRESGLDIQEARRQAIVAFGGVENHKEALRDGRGLAWLNGMSLDFKLGLRMLVKDPGLTLVGVLGMAVAVAIGAVSFSAIGTVVDASLPLDHGDRVVAIQNLDSRVSDEGRRTHLHDLITWREALTTVEDLGAYRTVDRNLITRDGRAESVRIAEMTASGFRAARVPPLAGRYIHDEDERSGAPAVVVIGYDVWQNRFAGRSDIVGQTVQLGTVMHTVIGVMPQGFAFPINNRIWTPLRLDPSNFERGQAPPIMVFGRLAPRVTPVDAQRQLTAIGQRFAIAYPATHQHIRPQIVSYTRSFIDAPELAWAFHLAQVLVSMLLVVIGTNVAILVYARTASRTGEIAVRTALGASRGRVVAQLFAEALVLSSAAAAVGIVGARFALRQVDTTLTRMGGDQLPFWMHFGITPSVVLYVVALAIIAAVIVGVVPALKATQPQVSSRLQQLGVGGSGMRLGKTWTFLIVAQVAVTVAVLPVALQGLGQWIRLGLAEPSFATKQFLTATLFLDDPELPAQRADVQRSALRKIATLGATRTESDQHDRAFATRFANLRTELGRRLEAEPGVSAVVFSSAVPGGEPSVRIEVDSSGAIANANVLATQGSTVGVNRVDLGFFDAFDVRILAGRRFDAGDISPTATAVIVNRSFVQQVLGGSDPLGRRVRTATRNRGVRPDTSRNEAWAEIVGVVPDFPNPTDSSTLEPKLYRPLLPTDARPVTLAMRVRSGAPALRTGRLRELTVAVNPMLRLGRVATLVETMREALEGTRLTILAVALVTLSVLLLSAAGIYALMSFTVTRRQREIGIRAALGAGPRSVLVSILSRAAGQVGIGIAIGIGMVAVMTASSERGTISGHEILSLFAVAALMSAIGLVAAIGPARRALRIQPTEALRAE